MQRPQSIEVFGVLNIVFGSLGLFGALCGIAAQGFVATLRRDPNFRNPALNRA